MIYRCLLCNKVLHGHGLQPHLSYKHYLSPRFDSYQLGAMEVKPQAAFGERKRWNDYYYKGKKIVVCLGANVFQAENLTRRERDELKRRLHSYV